MSLHFYKLSTFSLIEQAMKELAVQLINLEAPIYGVGIQSHIPYAGPSIHLLKVILDLFHTLHSKTLLDKNVQLTWVLEINEVSVNPFRIDLTESPMQDYQSGSQNWIFRRTM